jgi:hypothetical protein
MKQKSVSLILFFALIAFLAVTVRANIKTQAVTYCSSSYLISTVFATAYFGTTTFPCSTTTTTTSTSTTSSSTGSTTVCKNDDDREDSICDYGAQTVAVYCGVNGNESNAVYGDVTLTRVVNGKGTKSYLIPKATLATINNVSSDTNIFTSPTADGAPVILSRLTGPNGLLQVNGPNDIGGSPFVFSWGGC